MSTVHAAGRGLRERGYDRVHLFEPARNPLRPAPRAALTMVVSRVAAAGERLPDTGSLSGGVISVGASLVTRRPRSRGLGVRALEALTDRGDVEREILERLD